MSEHARDRIEVAIILIAIASFFVHLLLILLSNFNLININDSSLLLKNPIAAIYTPFSFILIYEVYLLIYYLPKSITVYIGKQYEIITLVLIRRIFKDLAHLQLTPDWFSVKGDLAFTYDLGATVVLFYLIYVFYSLNPQKVASEAAKAEMSEGASLFIRIKNWMATLLVPIFVGMAVYSFVEWTYLSFFQTLTTPEKIPSVDGIFFDRFFTILILADVLLLLITFLRTDRFSTVIRNSGFIISTILIKVSFGTHGPLNSGLVVVAVAFGVTILAIQKRYDRLGFIV